MNQKALNNKGIAEVHSRRPLNELRELIWQFENESVVANVTTQTDYQCNRCWKIKSQSKRKEQWTCKNPIIKAIGVERSKANQNVRNKELAKIQLSKQ
jgi:DNA-directed RNA polymerase subunit RPC12/RpoP